ncbi:helix-turn-helix transcriptional regulator [Qipengyuania sediminis]|uniref:helix-turn-helix transcriptional regulator n=1 Tax=Qipengyuania sediminis TaxID=1532023 RepID=UPI00105AA8B8|nr:LuxR family transcriptional regulator [Qipengyuania sediminis]
MRDRYVLDAINSCHTPDALFNLLVEYYNGQGFGGVCYVAPKNMVGEYVLRESGMPQEWMKRYRENALHRFDPIPGMSFRLGRPERIDDLLSMLTNLTKDEHCFIAAFRYSGLTNGLAVPTYGPFGRPGFIGLSQCAHPKLLDEVDVALVSAVAQQFHTRMELLQIDEPPPGLSPRERQVLEWLAKGKSQADIAIILKIAPATVATHVRRLYHKLGVHDRIAAVTKAMARHLI